MATPKIVPREQGEGQIGSSAKGWGEAHITNTTTSSASQGGKLVLSSDDGAVQGNDHRLGVIEFKGAEDASGTLSLGASIESFADLAFTASENAGKLVFNTVDGTTASPVLTLDKDKKATFAADILINGYGGTIDSTTAAVFTLKSTSTDDTNHPTRLAFNRSVTGTDNLDVGEITFDGKDDGGNSQRYASILGEIADASAGAEQGRLSFKVTEYDGYTHTNGLIITGADADGEVDVTIAAGAGSTTTVNGDLTVTGDVVMVANLPTSDPSNAGQLWNDSNTIKVSAG